MTDRILITGCQGLLGKTLADFFRERQSPLAALDRTYDLGDFGTLEKVFKEFKPTVVLNPAGFTKVDQAEESPELAFRANVEGPKNLARLAQDLGAHLVHFSTDYVFDGRSRFPYTEEDEPRPLGVYGQTKWEGEKQVLDHCSRAWVLRVSWLYGSGRGNFLSSMLEKARMGVALAVAEDQVSIPNWTRDIAENLYIALNAARETTGLIHFVASGQVSRYDWIKKALGPGVEIRKASKGEFPALAQRPDFSALNNEKTQQILGVTWKPWDEVLHQYLKSEGQI